MEVFPLLFPEDASFTAFQGYISFQVCARKRMRAGKKMPREEGERERERERERNERK